MSSRVLPLGLLKSSRSADIKGFYEGRGVRQRLLGLGLVNGRKVRVLRN